LTQFDSQLRRRFAATIIETTLGDAALDAFANYNNKNLAPEIALDAMPDNVRFYMWWPQFDDGSRINMAGNKAAIGVPE